jgi:outer membrane protein assembly factor BamB
MSDPMSSRELGWSAVPLSDFWNDLVQGRGVIPPAALDPSLATTVGRICANAAQVAPPPGLADRLWDEVLAKTTLEPAESSPALVVLSGGRAPDRRATPERGTIGPDRWQTLTTVLATAAMLLVTFGGLYVGLLRQSGWRGDGGDRDWTSAQGNPARTGEAPGRGPTGPLGTLWRFQTGGRIGTAPAVAEGVVYVGSDDHNLYALDARYGTVLWKRDLGAEVRSSPSAAHGLVFVVVGNTLSALDAQTGKDRWTFAEANRDTTPNVAGGTVYLATRDNRFVALDAASGVEQWRTEAVKGIVTQTTAYAGGHLFASTRSGVIAAFGADGATTWTIQTVENLSSPAVADGVVYVASSMDAVLTFDAATGKPLWSSGHGSAGGTNHSPAVVDGTVYSADPTGTVYARDARTGMLRWSFATEKMLTALPTVADGTVFLAGTDHTLYILSAASGAKRWTIQLDEAIDAGPSIAGGVAYVGTRAGTLYAIGGTPDVAAPTSAPPVGPTKTSQDTGAVPRGTPELAWRASVVNASESSPAVVGGVAYVVDVTGDLVALDATTGTERWRYRHGPGGCSDVAVVAGMAYAGCLDSFVYALDAATGQPRWSYDVNMPVDTAVVVDGVVYAGTTRIGSAGAVVAIDAATGQERWRIATAGDVGSVAVTGGVVYAAASPANSTLLALDDATGKTLWSRDLPGCVCAAPAVGDGVLFVGSPDGVFAVDMANGDLRWRFAPADDARLQWTPAVAGDLVYASGSAPDIYALDAATGAERWHAAISALGSLPVSPPTVADGMVYVGGDGLVVALDAVSGNELWRFTGDFSTYTHVTIGDGVILFGVAEPAGTDLSHLYAVRGAVYALANPDQRASTPGGVATPT